MKFTYEIMSYFIDGIHKMDRFYINLMERVSMSNLLV